MKKNKFLLVEFSNGIRYEIPIEAIAEHRAEYYINRDIKDKRIKAKDKLKAIKAEIEYALDEIYECIDWASNNMDWKDIEQYAIYLGKKEINYNEEWSNIAKEIIEK